MQKTKYAVVGTGGRSPMFLDPIAGRFRSAAELVGLCDPSHVRRAFHQQRLASLFELPPIPEYDDFDRMLSEQSPDVVVVCTPDYLHHEYIIRSLDFGADVVSEKPMTTDAAKCRAVFDAVERTARKVRVTFNMRWGPGVSKVRELIAAGEIGRICHVDFEYLLDASHGADYFRRWHSQKEYSGGLLVHKATHHFDAINWWLDAIPSEVFAMGGLKFYGRQNAMERGDEALTRYPRYTGYPEALHDPFSLTLDGDSTSSELYLNAEDETGYIRDRNVFREGIDIEDSMSLLIKYRTGAMVAYSLNAFCPREGFRVSISGDRGRIDYEEHHSTHVARDLPAPEFSRRLTLQKIFSMPADIEIPTLEGGHGGGDPLLQEQIFSADPPNDPLLRYAGHEQGAASLLIGAAANQSMATGRAVQITDLLPLKPDATRLSGLI